MIIFTKIRKIFDVRLKNAEKVILMCYETEAQKIIISMKKL